MTGRRAILGLCMLSALGLGAMAAPGAVAATKGTTSFTCKKKAVEGGAGFSREHCKVGDAVASGAKYEHVAIAESTTTELSWTNHNIGANTNGTSIYRLKTTLNGVAFEMSVAGVAPGPGTTPWIENRKAVSGEHYIHSEGKTHYTGVKVTKPSGSGCEVFADSEGVKGERETIRTNQLTATSEGQGDALLITPATPGQPVATFYLANCVAPFEVFNGTHLVGGKVKTTSTDGATISFAHANITSQGTLFLDNEFTPIGIDGTTTLSGRAKGSEGTYTPLSSTTVETP